MKVCPRCGSQIRPSVIRCVHCGTSLTGEQEPLATDASLGWTAVPPSSDPPGSEDRPSGAEAPAPEPAQPSLGPAVDPWVTPATRADGSAPAVLATRRPVEVPRSTPRRVDGVLMIAGVLALGGAVVGYSSLAMPWVHARLLSVEDRGPARLVADLTFQGSGSLGGSVGLAVAVTLLALGLLWFWYALDRGVGLPTFAHPLIALLAAATGGVVLALSRIGYFFWDDAFVSRSRDAGLSREGMRRLLESRPAPVIEVDQLGGTYRFGLALALALIAATVAWWSQRRRGTA
jgi:hypothetical protein